jgi:AcrR family transcriptional regulator
VSAPVNPEVRRGRPRDQQATAKVLDSVVELICEQGLAQVTTDEVARRAGVSATLIYRRWPTKFDLLSETFVALIESEVGPIEPAPFAVLLEDKLRRTIVSLTSTAEGQALLALIGESLRDPQMREVHQRIVDKRYQERQTLIDAAVAYEGRIPGLDYNATIDAVFGMVYTRLIFSLRRVSPDEAGECVQFVLGPYLSAKN